MSSYMSSYMSSSTFITVRGPHKVLESNVYDQDPLKSWGYHAIISLNGREYLSSERGTLHMSSRYFQTLPDYPPVDIHLDLSSTADLVIADTQSLSPSNWSIVKSKL